MFARETWRGHLLGYMPGKELTHGPSVVQRRTSCDETCWVSLEKLISIFTQGPAYNTQDRKWYFCPDKIARLQPKGIVHPFPPTPHCLQFVARHPVNYYQYLPPLKCLLQGHWDGRKVLAVLYKQAHHSNCIAFLWIVDQNTQTEQHLIQLVIKGCFKQKQTAGVWARCV